MSDNQVLSALSKISKMKKTLLITTLGLFLNLITTANPSNLIIEVDGYNSEYHKNYADIIVPDINYPYKKQVRISSHGIINISLIIPFTKEVVFSYDGRTVPIIISPDDNVVMRFKIDALQTDGKKIQGEFNGKNEETNNLIYDFNRLLEKWIANSSGAFNTERSIGELEYQLLRLEEVEDQLKRLEELVKVNDISDEVFIEWAKSKIKFAAGKDLALYPFIGIINRTITETDDYFKFIDDLKPKNRFIASLNSYTDYLSTLISSLEIIGNVSDEYKKERNELRSTSLSIFPIKFKIIRKSMSGIQRDLALTNAYLKEKELPSEYIDSLNLYLQLEEIEVIKIADSYRTTPILELLRNFDLKEEEKSSLVKIFKSTRGKIVFHDFWFEECPPCIKELPYYNDLISKSGQGVEFIFYGVYMNEERWKATIKRLGLRGKHILLSKNQIAFFERYFQLKSFPHHQLTDRKGLIKKEYLPSVNPENYERILNKLEKMK